MKVRHRLLCIAVILLVSFAATIALGQKAAVQAPLRNSPVPLEPGKSPPWWNPSTGVPRIAAWLFQGFYQELPHGSFRGDIMFIGDGAVVSVQRVCDGQAHFTITTPSPVAYMFVKGIGVASKPCPTLRGLFKMPQRDLITLAVRADLGVKTFDEIIQKKIPLKMATGPDNTRAIGFLYREFLKASGTSEQEVESWGGGIVAADLGGTAIEKVTSGEANALFQEGDVPIAPNWKPLNAKYPMRVLSIRDDVIEKLKPLGFTKFEYVIPKGKYAGFLDDVSTIDYSDWIVLADAAVPDEIAYRMAKIGAERKAAFESQYPKMLPEGSKELDQYPAVPAEMWKDLGAPLHPGAAKYFKEKGYMK